MEYNLNINVKPLKLFNPIDMTFAVFFRIFFILMSQKFFRPIAFLKFF